jgi:peptidoglycan/LPS O-acetylase OafA/YrhL
LHPLAKLLSLRPFTFLGDISYAVYLAHVPLQMISLAVANGYHWTIPTASDEFFAVYVAVLIFAGTLLHYGVERPSRRCLRNPWAATPRPLLVVPAA